MSNTDADATKVHEAASSAQENLISSLRSLVKDTVEDQEVISEHEKVTEIEESENSSDENEMTNPVVNLGFETASQILIDIIDFAFPKKEIISADKNAIEEEEYEEGSSNGDEIENSDGILGSDRLEAIYGNQKIIDALGLDTEVFLDNEKPVNVEDPSLALEFKIRDAVDFIDSVSISHETMQESFNASIIKDGEFTEDKAMTNNFDEETLKKGKKTYKNKGDEQKKEDKALKNKPDTVKNCEKTSNSKYKDKKMVTKTSEDKKGEKISIALTDDQKKGKKITKDEKIVQKNLNVKEKVQKRGMKSPIARLNNSTKKGKETLNAKDDEQKKIVKTPDDDRKKKKLPTSGPKMVGKGWNYGTWKRFTL